MSPRTRDRQPLRRPPGGRGAGAAARPSRRGSAQLRLRVGLVLIAMVMSLFAARLVQLQGIDPEEYAAMAAARGTREVVLPAARGDIVDRTGEPLAVSVEGLMVIADPSQTRDDAPEIARILATGLDADYFTTLQKLQQDGSRYEYVARRVPSTTALAVVEEVKEAGFAGVYTEGDPVRDYPAGDVAANVLGWMGTDEPLSGFELTFDDQLAGTDGSARYQVGGGNIIPLGDSSTVEPVNGEDLQLTIDRDVQWYTQRVLAQTVEESGGESGTAIVMDTLTGELIALADYPTYDANSPLLSPDADRGSRALNDVYEPGSVQKALTAAALIDAGEVTPETRIEVPPYLESGDSRIGDYWEHGDLRLTLAGVLAKSSNIGTVLAANRFTDDELHDYLADFGLGQTTNLGVRGEARGILPAADAWTQMEHDRIAFGQSMSVTAVQMISAINAIANDGVLISPSIVQGTATAADGTQVGTDTATSHRVVSEQAARDTAEMMERVVDPEVGVAPGAQIPGYRVAGKTGTAQRAVDGGYDGTTVSFAGFAPADDPRFTVYVVVQDPSSGGGGTVAAPAFAQIMSHVLRKYAVAPTGAAPSTLPVEW
ncbi:peptidoglycan D,D-transpeptidase FtsI family protein [Nocardioides alkalitolerans]|uniref:peptidoglycan D,D-transpeptidase FtsI family protein n=1 Tax=Nocardioides alkalitolerans TaxID=281714 RepID=UPI000427F501|nr:penicillin-binding protein 2 [Nocardioides alkalitolerans]